MIAAATARQIVAASARAGRVSREGGPVYAKKLVRAFGEKVFDIIEAEPERLREVDGIGPMRAGRITAAWAEQKAVRDIMVFLHSHGVGTARVVRAWRLRCMATRQAVEQKRRPLRLCRNGLPLRAQSGLRRALDLYRPAQNASIRDSGPREIAAPIKGEMSCVCSMVCLRASPSSAPALCSQSQPLSWSRAAYMRAALRRS